MNSLFKLMIKGIALLGIVGLLSSCGDGGGDGGGKGGTAPYVYKDQFGTPHLSSVRWSHAATLLNDGTVLITGGYNGSTFIDSAEAYDPVSGSFTALTSTMTSIRSHHTATLLNDGTVLITGGWNGSAYVNTFEFFY